ncbi:hypothetical protein DES44_4698 [Roseateles depolymerans]|uniref:Uncharacterized protein n=2 Tax=Roseateles depolymerans TaxID=76731 RepID=A0A0U3MKH3_9BURK|nr:hypothetical protein RD2015_4528 [Roseateles depolymerans]REG10052.1 hypothetical protein DES44_4698 [Roseateles depolymerans]
MANERTMTPLRSLRPLRPRPALTPAKALCALSLTLSVGLAMAGTGAGAALGTDKMSAAPAKAAAQALSATPAAPSQSCSFTAFVEDQDPAGLRVREAPDAKARILGTLPPVWTDGDGMRVRVSVKVTEAAHGWFKVRDAFEDTSLTGQPARPLYAGEGWVSGRMLVVKSQAQVGRQRPDAKAPVSVRLQEDASFDGNSTIRAGRLVGCQGQWAQVEFDESRLSDEIKPLVQVLPAARAGQPRGRFRTWLDQICAIQETTCDGDPSTAGTAGQMPSR